MVNSVQGQAAQASPGSPWLLAQLPAGTGTAALCPVASAKLSLEKGAALPRLQQLLGRKQVLGNMAAAVFPASPAVAGRESSPSLPGWHQVHRSSSGEPALAQVDYHPRAGTLCSALPLPPPSHPLGSQPGSHLHPPTVLPLPPCQPQQAVGLGGGLASPCPFCCGQARLGGHGHLPFLASIRLLNSCPVSLKCFWLRLLSAFHFLWFAWIWAVRVIKKNPQAVDKHLRKG